MGVGAGLCGIVEGGSPQGGVVLGELVCHPRVQVLPGRVPGGQGEEDRDGAAGRAVFEHVQQQRPVSVRPVSILSATSVPCAPVGRSTNVSAIFPWTNTIHRVRHRRSTGSQRDRRAPQCPRQEWSTRDVHGVAPQPQWPKICLSTRAESAETSGISVGTADLGGTK